MSDRESSHASGKAAAPAQSAQSANGEVPYVIVVHGVGEQRRDDTVQEVIQRFAEIRHGAGRSQSPFTLGMLRAQSGRKGWIEMDSIPVQSGEPPRPFIGRPTIDPGSNIRFVDFHWADILQRFYPGLGEPVKKWGSAIIERLRASDPSNQRKTLWMRRVLESLLGNLRIIETFMRLKYPLAKTKIFDQFLGDVQLYGESAWVRGKAVLRFHEVMEKIHSAHLEGPLKDRPPKYIIIAHSLGSIMALEALLYAHGTDAPGDHLPGYEREKKKVPTLDWAPYVKSFVTLGSPIDKFLLMWWHNYDHWIHGERFEREDPIDHFNYCDEQDPIGHRLDFLQSAPAYNRVFRTAEDEVFYRYPFPGKAHVDYWKDQELFARVLALAVDGKSAPEEIAWFKGGCYILGQICSYFLPGVAALSACLIVLVAHLPLKKGELPWSLFFWTGLVSVLGLGLSKFMVLWRQSLVWRRLPASSPQVGTKPVASVGGVPRGRVIGGAISRTLTTAIPIVLTVILAYLYFVAQRPLLPMSKDGDLDRDALLQLGLILGTLFSGWVAACLWYYRTLWKGTGLPTDFLTYVKTDPSMPTDLLKPSTIDPTSSLGAESGSREPEDPKPTP